METAILENLLDISRKMAEERVLEPLLDYAMDSSLVFAGAEAGYIILLDEQGRLDFRVKRSRGGEEIEEPETQISQTILSRVITQNEDLISSDAIVDPRFENSESIKILGLRSVMCVPLIARGKTIGALYVENRSMDSLFNEDNLPPLKFLASQAAVAIENAILNENLEERVRARTYELEQLNQKLGKEIAVRIQAEEKVKKAYEQVTTLRQLDLELSTMLDIEYVMDLALDASMRMSMANSGFIGLLEEKQIRVSHVIGHYPGNFIGTFLESGKGIIGRVIKQGAAELITDVRADDDYEARIADTVAKIVVPLVSANGLIGILNLESSREEVFTEATFEMMNVLAVRIAVAVDNASMYEETRQLAAELDAFAHTVAHDLKTPLSSMMGFSGMLQMDPQLTSDKARQNLQAIERATRRMSSIIDSLLLLASVRKLEEVKVSPLTMGQIVDDVLERFAFMVDGAGAKIILPDSWPVAFGYASWVEEIWANYISNAIKYGGKPPRVELGADAQKDGLVRFWVRDNGAGLSEEEQAQLFTPFIRLEQVQIKGHGLGLSIVQRIVERLGGQVGVESQKGKGATFYFTLPGV